MHFGGLGFDEQLLDCSSIHGATTSLNFTSDFRGTVGQAIQSAHHHPYSNYHPHCGHHPHCHHHPHRQHHPHRHHHPHRYIILSIIIGKVLSMTLFAVAKEIEILIQPLHFAILVDLQF